MYSMSWFQTGSKEACYHFYRDLYCCTRLRLYFLSGAITLLIGGSDWVIRVRRLFSAVCRMMRSADTNSSGLAALFTVLDQAGIDLVDSLTEMYTIPMIQTIPDFSNTRWERSERERARATFKPELSGCCSVLNSWGGENVYNVG